MKEERVQKIISDLKAETGREWEFVGGEFLCETFRVEQEGGKFLVYSRSLGQYFGSGGRTVRSAFNRARIHLQDEIGELKGELDLLSPPE